MNNNNNNNNKFNVSIDDYIWSAVFQFKGTREIALNIVFPLSAACRVSLLVTLLHFAAASLTPCQKEYQERIRSWLLPGPYIPQCTHQGMYEPMQCDESYCYCVNEHGVELVGSRMDIIEGQPKCTTGGKYCTFYRKIA